jgi:hypothetical protein
VKLENVFVSGENSYKVGDFSVSRELFGTFEKARTVAGTPFNNFILFYFCCIEECDIEIYLEDILHQKCSKGKSFIILFFFH